MNFSRLRRKKCPWWYSFFVFGIFFFSELLAHPPQGEGEKFNTIILDAGHGGYDLGGRALSGMHEKGLTLDIVHRMAKNLRDKGYHVVLTRNNDTFIPLKKRTAISNRLPHSVFISIHINWSRNRQAHGLETFYYQKDSQNLARSILRELGHVYYAQIRGVKHAKFYVLRHNVRPSVLCELGFDSHRTENSLLQNAQHRESLAEAVVDGISNQVTKTRPSIIIDSPPHQ